MKKEFTIYVEKVDDGWEISAIGNGIPIAVFTDKEERIPQIIKSANRSLSLIEKFKLTNTDEYEKIITDQMKNGSKNSKYKILDEEVKEYPVVWA